MGSILKQLAYCAWILSKFFAHNCSLPSIGGGQ